MAGEPTTEPLRTDVAVVGAGAAGLYAALTAAREGARVVLTLPLAGLQGARQVQWALESSWLRSGLLGTSYAFVMAARIVTAAGAGIITSAASSTAVALMSPEQRGKALACCVGRQIKQIRQHGCVTHGTARVSKNW